MSIAEEHSIIIELNDMSTTGKQTEAALVCQARQGDKESLYRLLERHVIWLKGLLYNILGNIDDVDDALQNIYLLVMQNIGGLREPERFRQWLAVVARNEALSYRQRRSRRTVPLDEYIAEQQSDSEILGISEKVAQKEQNQIILEAIKALPEKYREVFIMKYIQESTYAEISEILDIAVTTVQIRLVRARRMIYNRITGKPTNKVPRT